VHEWPTSCVILLFSVAAAVIAYAGSRLTRCASLLAERTRLGQALFGSVFLGAVTSLSGITTSVASQMVWSSP
jgi:cation:H+ antiporter